MSELEKFALNDEELDNIAGGVVPWELWKKLNTEERQNLQNTSNIAGLVGGGPCKLDEGYVWDEEELKALYESHGLKWPGMENIDFSIH